MADTQTAELKAAKKLLAEAMEWIERPVADNEDAAMFLAFEERVRRLLPDHVGVLDAAGVEVDE